MTRGRKPLPAEDKRARGNPGKRPIGDPVLVGERLTGTDLDRIDTEEVEGEAVVIPALPPTLQLIDELDDDTAAAELWRDTCILLIEAGILAEGDLFMLEQFVMATLEARRAYFELRTTGSTVEATNARGGRTGSVVNPAYRVWRDSSAMMLKLAAEFGLTPIARSRLGLNIGKGRKIQQELERGIPKNPVERTGDVEGSARDLDMDMPV